MDNSFQSAEIRSVNDNDSIPSNSYSSTDYNKAKKAKKYIKVEKIGENEEYDKSLLKRRK